MGKRGRSSNKGLVVLIVLLAVLCIGGAELAASYFFAPALFERVTAPVRRAAQSVAAFCGEAVADLSELLERWEQERQTPETPPPQDTVPETQLADEPLVKMDYVFADPTITELRSEEGEDILTGGILEIEYFNQTEEPWAGQPYGRDTIGPYGCGPTAMAMVVNSMTDYESDPAQMAQWAVDNGYWASKHGSYLSLVEGAAQAHGLTASPLPELTAQAIQDALLSGNLIVALMGPGHFTKGGHFIVLRGITLSGTVLVADPASTERSLTEWEAQLIVDELSASRHDGAPLWAVSAVP